MTPEQLAHLTPSEREALDRSHFGLDDCLCALPGCAELDRVTGERDALWEFRLREMADRESACESVAVGGSIVTPYATTSPIGWTKCPKCGGAHLVTESCAAPEGLKCEGCEGKGMIGGLAPDGYHSEKCGFCGGTGRAQVMLTNRAAKRMYGAANPAPAVRPEYAKAAEQTGYGDIQLVREGDYAVVKIQSDGEFIEVMRESLDSYFSHFVTPIGIAEAIEKRRAQ